MESIKIPFNQPFISGRELDYIRQAVEEKGHISGNGDFTKKCQQFFRDNYGFGKTLLTSSCTDALEMAAILCNIQPGDEVIVPSYTFVSTANAFMLRGAKIVFADSRPDHPGMDEGLLAGLITEKTKAIVVVHYAGMACDMDQVVEIASQHNLWVIEDAAQAIDSFYTDKNGVKKPLGSIGHLAAFSFHETKNIVCGEGGMLVVNDATLEKRAEIIWEKGTNRTAFYRGEVNKYGWVDLGSSFLPSDMAAAFLYAQLEHIEQIQNKRIDIWNRYHEGLKNTLDALGLGYMQLPHYATNNGHMYFIICRDNTQRASLIDYLKSKQIFAVFHYQSLEKSEFFESIYGEQNALPYAAAYTDRLLRLPFYYNITPEQQERVIAAITEFLESEQSITA